MHLLWCIIIQDEFIVLLSIEMGWGGGGEAICYRYSEYLYFVILELCILCIN